MGRGYSRRCAIEHRKVREIYKRIVDEEGEKSKYLAKEYFLGIIHKETGYAIITIRKILNRKQTEIDVREQMI